MSIHNQILPTEVEFVKKNSHLSAKELSLILKRHRITVLKIAKKHNIKLTKPSPTSKNINNSFFKEYSEDMFYILGFIAADGYIIESKGNGLSLGIGLSIRDEQHLRKICNCMKFTGKFYFNKKTNSIKFSIGSREICLDLLKFNITPRKSLTLEFPNNIPNEYLNHFIRGYFDGDGTTRIRRGYLNKNKNFHPQFEFSILGTFNFLSKIKEIFNLETKTNIGNIEYMKDFNIYRLTFAGTESAKSFGDYIYNNANFFLERKRNRFLQWNKIKGSYITLEEFNQFQINF